MAVNRRVASSNLARGANIISNPSISCDLFINPDEKDGYAQARGLWLEQAERYPYFPDVLLNAASCLRLTDRAKAATWLKGMSDYGRRALWDVYADAIAGVSGETPLQRITSVDPAERNSEFAKSALEERWKGQGVGRPSRVEFAPNIECLSARKYGHR